MKSLTLLVLFLVLKPLSVWAMGQRLPAEVDDSYKESEFLPSSYCPQLPTLAKSPKWRLQNPSGKFVDQIVVDKSRRLLYLFVDGQMIRTYKMAMGAHPIGPKRQEGDEKTPEGLYKIEYKNPESKFHLSLKIDYPNDEDRKWAQAHGVDPGGDVMIHGLPNNPIVKYFVGHPKRNWTDGCVAVNDAEIEEIYALVNAGTAIELCK